MTESPAKITVIGAGINGLVAANYLARAGHHVTLIEKSHRVGGACVSETAMVDGTSHAYPLGATTLGLMQKFVWQETGLAGRLHAEAAGSPGLAFFPDVAEPAHMYADVAKLSREIKHKWGEKGDLVAYHSDLDRVVEFLQAGYRTGRPPNVAEAEITLGKELTKLWITGSASALFNHYLTSDFTKLQIAQNVTESGPVSLYESYSAFTIPIMNSGSVFDGKYGYVRGGIWQITHMLGQINQELGVDILLSSMVREIDTASGTVHLESPAGAQTRQFDHIVFATDPQTAANLINDSTMIDQTHQDRVLGTSGKLNLMFRNPVRWKAESEHPKSDAAFRYIFDVDTVDEFEAATVAVLNGAEYVPGFFQVYCEGAALRHMGAAEPYDRLTVFFKNLALGKTGEQLAEVEAEVKAFILSYIANPEDCVWSRLLSPRDLQQTFGFPGGNIEHTVLAAEQTYFDRQYAADANHRFYQFGAYDNISICGSSTYPCGSVTGTPGYMCVAELLRHMNLA